ncbi:MAG TPA: hypothetical protein VHC63_13465 [Acidimicrobiales bacterium]|nr:hypothetical protein [Acidimicrobiales bacterium]
MADDDRSVKLERFVIHAYVPGSEQALCGAPVATPPFERIHDLDLIPCNECAASDAHRSATIRNRLDQLRASQAGALRVGGPKHRAWFRQNIRNLATASLLDQEASPVFYDEAQLLAVVYMAQAIRSALYTHLKQGLPLSWAAIDALIQTCELIMLAMAEGVPAA